MDKGRGHEFSRFSLKVRGRKFQIFPIRREGFVKKRTVVKRQCGVLLLYSHELILSNVIFLSVGCGVGLVCV